MERSHPLAVALNGYGLQRPDGGRDVLPWHDLLQIATTAEETGYEAIFAPEIGAREAFSTLVRIAAATTSIHLATGVAPIGSRDDRRMAMEAATASDLSRGRFVLGLGSSLPLEETRRRVAAIRALLRGERAADDLGSAIPPLDLLVPGVPIYLAALGPRMTRLAGEVADGVVLNWCRPERVAAAREQVAGSGRHVRLAVYVRACLGQEDSAAREALASAVSQYASMPTYRRQLEAMGLGKEARSAERGDVPEALIDAVCLRGSPEEALGRIGAYREAGADLVVVYPVPALDAASSILGTVMALAPRPALER